jgi:hypothetical protein
VRESQAPSITSFRRRIGALVRREASAERSRSVLVFAVDGVSHEVALEAWPRARTTPMRSVFPTTSSVGWLSSLTGLDAGEHGVPGVVFRLGDGELIDVYSYHGDALGAARENVFSDAAAHGYAPLALLGDLASYPCSWRDLLLAHSRPVQGCTFFTASGPRYVAPELKELESGIRRTLSRPKAITASSPCLAWCFVELDRHVHHHGYDGYAMRALALIERLAAELAEEGWVVVAHSDHGHAATAHDRELEGILERLRNAHGFGMGGAGRARWLYPGPGGEEALAEDLRRELPPGVALRPADELFPARSLARRRVGDLVLVAEGEAFLAQPGYRFDHGSLTPGEVLVPFSEWHA